MSSAVLRARESPVGWRVLARKRASPRILTSRANVCWPCRHRSPTSTWLAAYASGSCAADPQLVHGPGPDGLVLVELAERPRVLAPRRQPVLEPPAGGGALARADRPLRSGSAAPRSPAQATPPPGPPISGRLSPPGSGALVGWGQPSARLVTCGDDYLGRRRPVRRGHSVVGRRRNRSRTGLREVLGVPVIVLRLLRADGGDGGRRRPRDVPRGRATPPGPQPAARPAGSQHRGQHRGPRRGPRGGPRGVRRDGRAPFACGPGSRRPRTARLGLGRPRRLASSRVTGPAVQRKAWNLAALFPRPRDRPGLAEGHPPLRRRRGQRRRRVRPRGEPALVPSVIGGSGSCSSTCPARTAGTRQARSYRQRRRAPGGGPASASQLPGIRITLADSGSPSSEAEPARTQPARTQPARTGRPARAGHRRADPALLDGPVADELSAGEVTAARGLLSRFALLDECGLPTRSCTATSTPATGPQ